MPETALSGRDMMRSLRNSSVASRAKMKSVKRGCIKGKRKKERERERERKEKDREEKKQCEKV